jgi:hypothetical protein
MIITVSLRFVLFLIYHIKKLDKDELETKVHFMESTVMTLTELLLVAIVTI